MNLRPRIAALLLLALARPLFAVDITRPAALHITLTGPDNRPLPNAKVTLAPNNNLSAKPLSATTDTSGNAALQQIADTYNWNSNLLIDAPGFIPLRSSISLFSNAQIDLPIRLNPARTTTLTLLTPDHQPAAHVPFNISYSFQNEYNQPTQANYFRDPAFLTDNHGQFTLTHPPITGDLTLTLAGRRLHFPDVPQFSATFTPDELQQLTPAVSLHLTLLNPDGSPANNWLVAAHVDFDNHSGSFPGGPMNRYIVSSWQPLATDGSFSTDAPGQTLLLLSPEGLPLLFALNPQAWAPGTHELRLTLPPIESNLAGRFVDNSKNPLPNIPLYANALRSSTWGSIRVEAPNVASVAALSGPFPNTPPLPQIRSGPDGRFSIPLRFGMDFDSWQAGTPWTGPSYIPNPQIGEADTITLVPSTSREPDPASLKEVILQFLAPDGALLPKDQCPWIDSFVPSPNPTNNSYGQTPFIDRRGLHYFIPRAATEVTIEPREERYKTGTAILPLTDADEQILPIQFQAEQRNKPITGRILDSSSRPLARVRVVPLDERNKNPGTNHTRVFYTLATTTDADGRFSIPGAPDDCQISISRADPFTGESDIPYIKPLPVTADKRDLIITLPPAGAALILLPAAMPPLRYVTLYPDASAEGAFPPSLFPDPLAHTLHASAVPPGRYHLQADAFPALTNFPGAGLAITADQTATLDLRNAPLAPAPETRAATLTVTADGKPLPGVEVAIFSDPVSHESTQNNLHPLTLDLTDARGQIRFNAPPDKPLIALARLRGRYEGSLEFTLSASPAPLPNLTLPLQPATTPTPLPKDFRGPPPPDPAAPLPTRALPLLTHSDHTWSTPNWPTLP